MVQFEIRNNKTSVHDASMSVTKTKSRALVNEYNIKTYRGQSLGHEWNGLIININDMDQQNGTTIWNT